MRKIILLGLIGVLFAGSWMGVYPSSVQAADPYTFSDGDGSPGDPYVVLTAEDMDHVRDDLDANYKQGADIDLSGYAAGSGWEPIGTLADPFTGTFDGNHYTISDLYIRSSGAYVGIFGLTQDSMLQHIRLVNVDVAGESFVGGLVGQAVSTAIMDSSVTGLVYATYGYVGGLAGYLSGPGAIIQNSYAAVDVSGITILGGLLGTVDTGTNGIESSYASGNVTGRTYVGGLVGDARSSVQNSYATGNVDAVTSLAAGLVSNVAFGSAAVIRGSFQTGAVTGGAVKSGVLIGNFFNPPLGGAIVENLRYNTTLNPSWPDIGSISMGVTITDVQGLSDAAMKTSAAYGAGFDFVTVWGIKEGISYPYLRAFKPNVTVDVLPQATYRQNSMLTIDGFMMDGSMGEPVHVDYEIRDSSNQVVTSSSQAFPAATGVNQGFSFTETLDDARFPEGVYTVNVTAQDDGGQFSPVRSLRFAVDHTPPVITLNGTSPMDVLWGSTYIEPGATAMDAIDGNLTAQLTVSGAVYTNRVGSYTLTYEVADATGYRSTETRTVNVVDTDAPVISLNGANPIQIAAGSVFIDPGATAQDTVDGDLTSEITVTGAVYANQVGSYSLTYSVQDSSGNAAADVIRTVNVVSSGGGGGSPIVQRSNNANLAQLTLRIEGTTKELTPAFTPGITEYTVETDGELVELQLSSEDSKAVVQVLNKPVADRISIPLDVGIQTVKITVQAEDGTLRVYNLAITRLADKENESVPAPPACPFTDIQGHWAKADICESASLKIVEGISANTFAPDKTVTRTEFAVMLLRTLQIPIVQQSAANPFSDKESIPEWARLAIHTGAAKGILDGYPDGTFRPQQKIDRTEMAAMLAKALKWETNSEPDLPFSDGASIPAWAQSYVKVAHANGLLQGRGGNQFVPHGMTTRAEAAVVMLRIWKTLN